MEKSLRQIFNAHKKTHWLHEYAEDGIVNFNDLQKIVREHKSNQVQAAVKPEIAETEDYNLPYKYLVVCRALAYELKHKQYDTETINAFGLVVDDIPEV